MLVSGGPAYRAELSIANPYGGGVTYSSVGTAAGNADLVFAEGVNSAPPVAPVPEPATLGACALMGVAGFGYVRRRMKGLPAAG